LGFLPLQEDFQGQRQRHDDLQKSEHRLTDTENPAPQPTRPEDTAFS
jgi:hypothetical protein